MDSDEVEVNLRSGQQFGVISLRDYFAGQALIGIVTRNPVGRNASCCLKHAYQFADQMLIEREVSANKEVEQKYKAAKRNEWEDCIRWARSHGLTDTRALKCLARAGICDFQFINRAVLEEVRNCGEATIALLLNWKKNALESKEPTK
jgi:hypothetical protein